MCFTLLCILCIVFYSFSFFSFLLLCLVLPLLLLLLLLLSLSLLCFYGHLLSEIKFDWLIELPITLGVIDAKNHSCAWRRWWLMKWDSQLFTALVGVTWFVSGVIWTSNGNEQMRQCRNWIWGADCRERLSLILHAPPLCRPYVCVRTSVCHACTCPLITAETRIRRTYITYVGQCFFNISQSLKRSTVSESRVKLTHFYHSHKTTNCFIN